MIREPFQSCKILPPVSIPFCVRDKHSRTTATLPPEALHLPWPWWGTFNRLRSWTRWALPGWDYLPLGRGIQTWYVQSMDLLEMKPNLSCLQQEKTSDLSEENMLSPKLTRQAPYGLLPLLVGSQPFSPNLLRLAYLQQWAGCLSRNRWCFQNTASRIHFKTPLVCWAQLGFLYRVPSLLQTPYIPFQSQPSAWGRDTVWSPMKIKAGDLSLCWWGKVSHCQRSLWPPSLLPVPCPR